MALAVTAAVTFRAYKASKKEQQIVERVLREYVAFASFQLQNNVEIATYNCLRLWFEHVATETNPLPIEKVPDRACGIDATTRFALDLNSDKSTTYGGKLSEASLSWLKAAIPARPALEFGPNWRLGVLPEGGNVGGPVAFAVGYRNGKAAQVVGFVTTRTWPETMLRTVVRVSQLLPPDFTDGAATDVFFDVTVPKTTAATNVLVQKGLLAKRSVIHESFGGFAIDLRLKPAAMDRIIPGGIPRDPGLELLSLFMVAVVLVLGSLVLLRRESELAHERAGFVSSVSHELRTPLAQIRMFAEMLLLGRVKAEADRRRSLEIIDKEAKRLSHLVDNVLQVARTEHGTVHVNPVVSSLASVVRETVENFMVLADGARNDFRLELEEDLIVPVDTEAVRQITLNLLDNAVKYGPKGQRVTVGVALFNDHARLWVDDEGPGVPTRERGRVFEAFYRSRRDLHSNTTGSGIGLSVVRELATLHGGTTAIEDAPGGGARVIVEFPGASIAPKESTGGSAVA